MSSNPSTDIHLLDTSKQNRASEWLATNGDMYAGCCKENILVQEVKGRYLLQDGLVYEGGWRDGKMSGTGKITWPSGDTYEGELFAGCRHGFGSHKGNNGVYEGNWFMDEMHGIGTRSYSNGDSYEGSWEHGVKQGLGRYLWKNGNVYVGDWKSGAMSGRGLLIWSCGCQHDGHFLNGLVHGSGVHTWANGDIYVGTWSRGLKDGRGRLFISPGSDHMKSHQLMALEFDEQIVRADRCEEEFRSFSMADTVGGRSITARFHRLSLGGSSTDTGSESSRDSNDESEENSSMELLSSLDDYIANMQLENPASISNTEVEHGSANSAIEVEMEYSQGILIREFVKENAQLGGKSKGQLIKNFVVSRLGKAMFYRGHRSSEELSNLQLGIRTSAERCAMAAHAQQQQQGAVSAAGFGPKDRICVNFPRGGSETTPPHQSTDFKWKDYCPPVFRSLRELFQIGTVDYVHSICSNRGLRELSSHGKSGSVFYLSHDDRFLIKTVRKAEVQVFLRLLPSYYHHVRRYPNTLITKFLGLHEIKPAGGRKVYFVVMLYLFPGELRIHQRFDLKGSSQGRSAAHSRARIMNESTCTLKDLDLNLVFRLGSQGRQSFLRQIDLDAKFLESQNIMDYSLLLGVHFQCPQLSSCEITATGITDARDGRSDSQALESMQGSTLEIGGMDRSPVRSQGVKLGWKMRARAEQTESKGNLALQKQCHHQNAKETYEVVLYVGIIDVLQRYNMGKRLEHAYKCLQYNSLAISAVDPSHYCKRFQDFISHIFLD